MRQCTNLITLSSPATSRYSSTVFSPSFPHSEPTPHLKPAFLPHLRHGRPITIHSFLRAFRGCPAGLSEERQCHIGLSPTRHATPESPLRRIHYYNSTRPSTELP